MVIAKQLSLIALLIFNLTATSQNFDEHHSGSWLEFYGDNKIHEKWSVPFAGILKHHYMFEMHDFSFIRTGISYRLSPSCIATGGIAYVNSKAYDESFKPSVVHQYWFYEEFTLINNFGRNTISNRWRLENRWINKSNDSYFRNRIRYRLQFTRMIYGKTYLKSSNEIFLNLNGTSLFDQNRFYIGLGQILTPTFKVDMGYLKNHFKSRHYSTISMGLTYSIDFTRKEIADVMD